jgi:hypothetical protein
MLYGGSTTTHEFIEKEQGGSYLKKYVSLDADTDVLQQEAFKSFLETNARMGSFNREFREPRNIQACHQTDHERLLVRARALIGWVLGQFQWGEFFDSVDHSTGTTIGVPFSDTSLERKFTFPISTTLDAAVIFSDYLSERKLLRDAIHDVNLPSHQAEWYNYVNGSRATTVEKSDTKRRMIAVEPTVNMYLQKGLMEMMYRRMKDKHPLVRMHLDVESLPFVHQELARRGSISGEFATIDFSSASDCVSIELIKWLLPDDWFEVVDQIRSPTMNIEGENYELNMVSTMGNAGTFPLETLVFWAIGVCTIMQQDRKNPFSLLSLPGEREAVSVFGDDCILPTRYATAFMANCVACGFIVNEEKSFFDYESRFRESCGGDYLQGVYVRPLCLKAPAGDRLSYLEPWLYTLLNGILPRYEMYFGSLRYVYDKKLLELIFGYFRKYGLLVKLIPPYYPDDAGLKTSDWRRLQRAYDIRMDKVYSSNQGAHSFRYCRFVYNERKDRNDMLRYALWLERPLPSRQTKIRTKLPLRKRGGYVVAKGLSSAWTI